MPNILLVDDDAESRSALRDLLELRGYEVNEAGDGKNALDLLLAGEEPSLIILDLEMPVMSGGELVDSMRRHPRLARIPVLVLSGSSKRNVPQSPIIAGFMQKPCDVDLLLALVRQTLQGGARAADA